ncbi:MAG: T9SS type A sorting domain-containing protein [Flavobacteriales bacterium]|nr:T9SS type A sorting domain-containing protein [Flavobacteriales bacterium]
MNRLYTLLIGSTLLGSFYGQTFNVGGPITSHTKYSFREIKDIEVLPAFDLDAVILANEANAVNKVGPYMFGYEHAVNYSLGNSGSWENLDNGDRIWRLRISSPGALSLNFVFSDFELPEGAHLHIYNADKSMVLGAYTAENNNANNELGTDLIKGDDATIEYFVPRSAQTAGRLHMTMAVHGYYDINNWYTEKVNESDPCNMDVICPDGDDWRDEIRSEARILAGGGLCSGTLLNNTAQDGKAYFLTANHCNPGGMGSGVFAFYYESPICGSQTTANSQASTTTQTVNGSTLRATKADSDFGLIELNSLPPNPYYAGWNNSGNTPQTAVGIHHPSGDVKKISFDDDVLQSASGLSSVANSEWRIEAWERNTTTEGGSSGSGLWDENHYIVGQLHGGSASCSNSINDYYGKFSMSWDGNGASSSAQRLHDWLDPQSTGATTLPGYDPNASTLSYDAGVTNNVTSATLCSAVYEPEITLKNHGQQTLTSCTITYNVDGGANNVYNWTGSLAANATEVVVLGSVSVSGSGSHTFNATVSNPNGNTDEDASNDVIASSFSAVPNSMPVYLNLLVDCYGEEVAWQITEQGSSTVLFSGADYPGTGTSPIANGTTVTEDLCLANGCYTFEITDTYGDGMSGSQYNGCNTDGDYNLEDYYGNEFFAMTQADYGTGTSHTFCVTTVGVDENDLSTMINVFPNPAEDNFSILLGNEDLTISSIQIVDVRGALVLNVSNIQSSVQTNVNVSSLSQGVYFVNITTDQGVVTKKVSLR